MRDNTCALQTEILELLASHTEVLTMVLIAILIIIIIVNTTLPPPPPPPPPPPQHAEI
jgi:hypothetical protein